MKFNQRVILETYAGSKLYGTSTPQSDTDLRGVCILPFREMVDPFQGFEQFEDPAYEDRVIFHLRKFFDLATAGNPNIIELLFAPDESLVTVKRGGRLLLENAELFVSQNVLKRFTGYATQQLNRMRGHKRWLDTEMNMPFRDNYGLPHEPLYSYDKLQNILNSPMEAVVDELRDYASREMHYRQDKKEWDEYSTWVRERNPNRLELELLYGYDTKHAMHLIRLLSEGKELLETGRLTFPRPDAAFLMDIRNGLYKYDEIMDMVSDVRGQMDSFAKNVPEKPDMNALRELYYNILNI